MRHLNSMTDENLHPWRIECPHGLNTVFLAVQEALLQS